MKTVVRRSLPIRFFAASMITALLVVPAVSQAQYGNTGTGGYALYHNTSGYGNTADGAFALDFNTMGYYNTADGYEALYLNITGSNNTAIGDFALNQNTTGYNNTANGVKALYLNITGYDNTASGINALYSNTTGYENTANGMSALANNTTGRYNTANGLAALSSNTTGYNNIALGYDAGQNITTGGNNIAIGNVGLSTDTGIIRIGMIGKQTTTYIAGISGETVSDGVEVYINANGQLGTLTSSRRFKNDINDMGSISDRLMQLRPVTFHYKDTTEKGPHSLQYGLIAEEVAKVYPNLVQYDKQGKPFTVYYHLLTPMLLNELQKANHRSVAQEHKIEVQMTEIVALRTALQEQKSELVSLKQAQQQQLKMLAKLAAYVQTSQGKEPLQKAVFAQH